MADATIYMLFLPTGATGFMFSQTDIVFSPVTNSTQCFEITIPDDTILEEDEVLTMMLSSDDEGVVLTNTLRIQIQDDDSEIAVIISQIVLL